MATTSLADRRYEPRDPQADYQRALARLHHAFSEVPFDADMPVCPHCVDRFDVAALGTDPTLVPPSTLARFVIKAGTTWGTPADLIRLVPGLLASMADQQLPLARGVVWAKLRWAGWPNWPDEQVGAVTGFLVAEWDRLLRARPRPAHAAHRWLSGVSLAVQDLEPLLTAWSDALGPLTPPAHHEAAVGHLVALLTDSPLRPDLPGTMGDVFPDSLAAAGQVSAWLAGPGTTEDLHRAVVELADTPSARRVALAAERHRRFAAAVAGTTD